MTSMRGHLDELQGIVADPGVIRAWAVTARAADVFVYATRASLPVASPGAKAARELAERGLVLLTQKPLTGGLRNYRATRTSTRWPVETGKCAANDVQPDDEAAAIDAVLPHLVRAARFALPCPTDAQLARKAGLAREAVQPVLAAMTTTGIIRIETMRAPTLRRVTIIETGHKTGVVR